MALVDDLRAEVAATFRELWVPETARSVPGPDALRLNSNHAKYLEEATALYAALDGSTAMVSSLLCEQAAELYKTYLRCASQIIRSEGGTITAYDGDRVMAIFTGNSKNTTALQ